MINICVTFILRFFFFFFGVSKFVQLKSFPPKSSFSKIKMCKNYNLDEEPWLNETNGCTFPSPWEPLTTDSEELGEGCLRSVLPFKQTQTKQRSNNKRKRIEEYVGDYGHPGFGIYKVYVNETGQLRYEFGLLLRGELTQTQDPMQMYMTIEFPIDYRMAFFPEYPDGFPVYFGSDVPGSIDSVEVPYLEFSLPPVFRREVVPS